MGDLSLSFEAGWGYFLRFYWHLSGFSGIGGYWGGYRRTGGKVRGLVKGF